MAIIIMVAILVAFFVAGLVGSGIPVVLRRMGQDPALASNIFLTLTVDLVSFGTFLLTASLLL
jgi:magnesium transporter